MTLADVRVLDLKGGIAGSYCTKLLADAGADVVVVERQGGVDRRESDPPGLFEYLHTSKRSVTAGHHGGLLRSADIVVTDAHFDLLGSRHQAPHQVIVTISPFGCTGPWRDRPATEFTLQADCGCIGSRGVPGEMPMAAGGRLGEWLTGAYGAVAALAALIEARRSGQGQHIDVAMLDCMAIGLTTFPSVFADFARTSGRPPMPAAVRSLEVPSIEPTADGWVTFTTNSAQQFSDFALLIGRPEVAGDERFAAAGSRFANREAFWRMTREYTQNRTTAEVLSEAELLRIPVAPVLDGSTVAGFEQFEARQVFVEHPSGQFQQPRVPYRIDGIPTRPFGAVPDPGGDDGTIDWSPRPQVTAQQSWRLPLTGIRVIDLTAWWAGPFVTHLLGSLGADVVKVESTCRPDLIRLASTRPPAHPQWWEWGPLAHATNTNKRGVTIDLTRDRGHDLALRLLSDADLVVENSTPRVMEQLGLDWIQLHERNPKLIMVRMPAFGLDGPWHDRTGFTQTMEALTGLAWVTGPADGPPMLVRGAGDPTAGLHATFALLVALWARAGDGRGRMVEAPMVEAVLNVAAEQPIAFQLTGRIRGRHGNGSAAGHVPQGVYPCQGHDEWIALTVTDDSQWERLRAFLDEGQDGKSAKLIPALPLLGPASSRRQHTTMIDTWLERRTPAWQAHDLVERLVALGIPAAVVIRPATVTSNPQLMDRGLFEIEDHPVTGAHRVPGLPFRMPDVGAWVLRSSPTLGEHNEEVLADLGLDRAELDDLRQSGIIGDRLAGG